MLNNKETELMKLAIETACRKVWDRKIRDTIFNFPQETSDVGDGDIAKIDTFHLYHKDLRNRDEKDVWYFHLKVVIGFSKSDWLSIDGFFESDETAGVNNLHGFVKSSGASIEKALYISVGPHRKPTIFFTGASNPKLLKHSIE